MKFLFTLLAFAISISSIAQGTYTKEQRCRDSLRLDSLALSWDLKGPRRVLANQVPRRITPRIDICFDKKFNYYANVNNKISKGCFYVNTKDGYVAMFYSQLSESCNGMNNFAPGYDMAIIAKTGDAYHYKIDKRGRRIFFAVAAREDRTQHARTEFIYKNASFSGSHREPFTDQNLPTLPYVIRNVAASSTRYLFGPSLPRTITIGNYLGAFGLGYFDDGRNNTYICLASESPNNFIKVLSIEDVSECFDGSSFTVDECANTTQEETKRITDKNKALDERAQDVATSGSSCAAVQQQIIAHEKAMLKKEAAANEYLTSGKNVMDPKNTEAQKVLAAAGDVKDQVIKRKLEIEKKICDVEYSFALYAKEYPGKSTAHLTKKKDCYLKALQELRTLEAELVAIDNQNRNNFSKAMIEKNMLYVKRSATMKLSCN